MVTFLIQNRHWAAEVVVMEWTYSTLRDSEGNNKILNGPLNHWHRLSFAKCRSVRNFVWQCYLLWLAVIWFKRSTIHRVLHTTEPNWLRRTYSGSDCVANPQKNHTNKVVINCRGCYWRENHWRSVFPSTFPHITRKFNNNGKYTNVRISIPQKTEKWEKNAFNCFKEWHFFSIC